MKITIIIDGLSRDYQGSYDDLYNRDWDKRLQDFIDDVEGWYNNEEVPDMFPGTMEELKKLTIRK